MIVGAVTVQTAGQEPAFRPIAGAPLALARFDAELAFLIVDALMFALVVVREFLSNRLNTQGVFPLL